LRLVTTLLVVLVIWAGASFATRASKFDEIEDRLRETTEKIDLGSNAAPEGTPVVIPAATPGWGPWVEASNTEP
jgi:hypothetical protein